MDYQSNALWPDGVCSSKYGDNISTDTHATLEQAAGVCKGLREGGFGGEGKHFPLCVWTSEVHQPPQLPRQWDWQEPADYYNPFEALTPLPVDQSICPHNKRYIQCDDQACVAEMDAAEAAAFCPHGFLVGCPVCVPTSTLPATDENIASINEVASSSDLRPTSEETVAIQRLTGGELPTYSTGICGNTTCGYGKLDEHGYWEFPLPPGFWKALNRAFGSFGKHVNRGERAEQTASCVNTLGVVVSELYGSSATDKCVKGTATTDAARLDWIEEQYGLHRELDITYVVDGYTVEFTYDGNPTDGKYYHGETLRAAIDAAMTKEKLHGT